jgi:polysaccharide pyruvyl transferase WcaK-like protein
VAYSKKFSGVFESMGVEKMAVDARESGMNTAIDIILNSYKKRDEIKSTLNNNLAPLLSQINRTFQEML